MRYSIGQVAAMSGVSTRTLRHYDGIGLLAPAEVTANGYRWYGREQLRRLQRILLLRDLDVPLPQVRAVLAGEDDVAAALRRHGRLVAAERDRLDAIAATIDRTLDDLEGRDRLPDEEFFRGLREGRTRLAATLRERFGPAAAAALLADGAAPDGWTRADLDGAASRARDLYGRLSRARRAGVGPSSATALDLVAEHHEAVLATWPATPAAYHALADLYESDPVQRAAVAVDDPDLPAWLAAAVRAYAVRRLGYAP